MKRLDEGKVSLVQFLQSIRFRQSKSTSGSAECPTHFAHLNPRARTSQNASAEDQQLVRSAN